MEKKRMGRDVVPQGYTLGLVLFDAAPVALFGGGCWLLWRMSGRPLVLLGGMVCFLAGMLKVLWKLLVVTRRKNVWPLFAQMRLGMPLGFTLILLGLLMPGPSLAPLGLAIARPGPILCLAIAALGMAGMILCGAKLDAADPKANWVEQGCNTVAQGAFLLAMILAYCA